MIKKGLPLVLDVLLLCRFLNFTPVSAYTYISGFKVAYVNLNETKFNIAIGQTYSLKATITPAKATNKNMKFISSNTKIVKIDTSGKVTAVSLGSAMIAVTTADGNKKSYATITVVSNWANKKFVTFGDSITWYDGKVYNSASKEQGVTAKGYQTYMRSMLNCVVVNKGKDGNDMTQIYSIINNYNYRYVNAVTITSGANDHRKGVLPGKVLRIGSKFNTETYAGALQASIEKIRKSNRNARIYLITPIKGWYNEDHTPSVPDAYKGQMTLSVEYVNVMKSIGKLYGISVCDLYNSTWINGLSKSALMTDKATSPYYLHPSTKGYMRIADVLIPFLK